MKKITIREIARIGIMAAAVSSVNAIVACVVAVPLGLALRPVMAKMIK